MCVRDVCGWAVRAAEGTWEAVLVGPSTCEGPSVLCEHVCVVGGPGRMDVRVGT